jgi:hypothetical protein
MSNGPTTQLKVAGFPDALPNNTVVTVSSGGNTETFTAAAAASGAMTLNVTSKAATFAYPVGSTVTATVNVTGTVYDGVWYDTNGTSWVQTPVPTTGDWVEMSVPCADLTDYNNAVSNTSEITFATGGTDPAGTTGVAIPSGTYQTMGNICVSNSASASSCDPNSNNWADAVIGASDITLEATGASSTISIDGNVSSYETGAGDGTFAKLCPAVGCPSTTAPTPGLLAYQADGWNGSACSSLYNPTTGANPTGAGGPSEPELSMSAIGGTINGTVFAPCGQIDVSYSSGGLGFLEGYDVDLYVFTGATGSGPFGSEGGQGSGTDQLTQ